jgi:predicted metalloprotease
MTMRFGGRRTSDNVESQRGMSFGGGGGGLGGGAGMLLGLVASRFGIGGVIVLVIIMAVFGGLGGLTGGGQQAVGPVAGQGQSGAGQGGDVCQSDETTRFSCQVLASTEDHWTRLFQASGRTYEPPRMVVYDRDGRSGCGAAESAMGPFYCPVDRGIYLDTSFFRELAQQHQAPGDFAQAYVIAHEVGHHIQTMTGTSDRIRQAQSAARRGEANALQVRMELQADCYAGVWAAQERGTMEAGDVEEGMTAAAAIGDDTLQRASNGRVVPESFTHGTAAQRQEALMQGYRGGTPESCASYTQGV